MLNAGKLRIRGAELEATWTPDRRACCSTRQIGYLDAEYKEFVDDRFPRRQPRIPDAGLRARNGRCASAANMPSIWARRAASPSARQTRYKSRTALAVDNTFIIGTSPTSGGTTTEVEGLFQKGYWVHDARIVYETADKHFALGLYGNNLSDKAYKTDAQEFSSVGNIRTVYYGAPRTFTLRLTARY